MGRAILKDIFIEWKNRLRIESVQKEWALVGPEIAVKWAEFLMWRFKPAFPDVMMGVSRPSQMRSVSGFRMESLHQRERVRDDLSVSGIKIFLSVLEKIDDRRS